MNEFPPSPDPADRSNDPGGLSSRDDARLLELLLGSPDRLDPQVILWADGRVLPESDPGRRTVVGWHRAGGAVMVGVTTGVAVEGLLLEAFQLAAAEGANPPGRWAGALATFWGDADPALRERVADRWGLRGGLIESPEAWADRAWGMAPAPGPPRAGMIAFEVPPSLRQSVDWLADQGVEVAAWEIARSADPGAAPFRFERVAGRWSGPPERPLPAFEEQRRRRTYVRHTGSVTAALLADLEAECRSSGAAVAWSDDQWVRFDGPRRSLRVFPGTEWIDLQFVGADEGTLIGLRYRYGVQVGIEPPPDAPPGVHLRLASPSDLGPEVRMLVKGWLGGLSSEAGEGGGPVTSRGKRSDAAAPPTERTRGRE